MSRTWVYSDPHFYHKNIVTFENYDGTPVRPWDDAEEMTEDMIARLRAVDISWSETGELCARAADHIATLEAERDAAYERAAQVAEAASHWSLNKSEVGDKGGPMSCRIVSGNIQRNMNAKWIAAAIRSLKGADHDPAK